MVDTGPLITLAVARSLDYLAYVDTDVVIHDAVLHEATYNARAWGRKTSSTGLRPIAAAWRSHRRKHTRSSMPRAQTFHIHASPISANAAVEVIEEPDRLIGIERGVLLCEETAISKRIAVRDRDRIVELSTLDFLRILEAENGSNRQIAFPTWQPKPDVSRPEPRIERA